MRTSTIGLSLALVVTFLPQPAMAQSEFLKDNVTKIVKKVGFHASTSFSDPRDKTQVDRDGSYGFSIGLAPGRTNGWRYPVGLAWFSESLISPSGTAFAKFRSRPVVAGIGYGWHFGKFGTGAQLQGGWAFNSVKAQGDIADAFLMPSNSVFVDVHNSWVLRPQVKVEYFLTEKFTLRSSLNYVFMHPRVDIRTPQGVTSRNWDASHVSLSMGVGFYPFRK
jgi:hypothetical protein